MTVTLRALCWLTAAAFSNSVCALSPVLLKQGINPLDINDDGRQDYVVVAQFDNNTSHPNLGLTFFVDRGDGGLSIMPVANSERFTWFDYRLSADAEFLIEDNQLFRRGNTFWLINAEKKGESPYDRNPFQLSYYRFTQSDDDPGVPLYQWSLMKKTITQNSYDSATQAWAEVDERDLQP